MRKYLFALALACAGCNPSPTAPVTPACTTQHTTDRGGSPYQWEDCSTSTIKKIYICQTQPREYIVDGKSVMEIDTYEQSTPCPAEPIR